MKQLTIIRPPPPRHMTENFPVDTDENIIQVVLAMINAVSLLYNFKGTEQQKSK
jgi:hypothetical protein